MQVQSQSSQGLSEAFSRLFSSGLDASASMSAAPAASGGSDSVSIRPGLSVSPSRLSLGSAQEAARTVSRELSARGTSMLGSVSSRGSSGVLSILV